MAEQGNNSDDDFLPDPAQYQNRLSAAIANIGTLRDFVRPPKRARTTQKKAPGRKATIVRMMFYLLPDGSEVPKFTKADPAIQTHQNHGFGYPAVYFEDNKGKSHPVELSLTEEELREKIRSLYNKLIDKNFSLFTVDNRKKLLPAPMNPSYFKDMKYQGRVIIKIVDAQNAAQPILPIIATQEEMPPVQLQLPTTTAPIRAPTPPAVPVQPSTTSTSTQTRESTVREEVSINPRHMLIMQQDLAFAESLAIDESRDQQTQQARLRRSLLRTERLRQRDLRKERLEQIQADAVEEVTRLRCYANNEDIVNISFSLPNGLQYRHLSKKTPSDQLHLYIESSFNVVEARLLLGNQVILRTQQTIEALGITANSRLVVEDNAIDSEDSDTEDEEDSADNTLPYNPTQLTNYAELYARRQNIYEHLLPSKAITVRRDNILADVMDIYTLDPSIVHHHLTVTFEGEEKAVDMEGVTREMFSLVIPSLIHKYFEGRVHKIPSCNISYMFDNSFTVIGRIIAHSFVLVNYLPPSLSPVIFSIIGSGQCSESLLVSSFLQFIAEEECQLVQSALQQSVFSDQMQLELINFFGTYNGRDIPSPSTLNHQLVNLAKFHLCCNPLFSISKLGQGLAAYPLLFQGVTESVITKVFQNYQPTAQKVINSITFIHSEDNLVLRSMEERVKNYLERYIVSLSSTDLAKFLRFWSSADTLCLNNLTVAFNSLQGTQRRPIANTCSATLQVSRVYMSAHELSEEFNTYVMHSSSNVFDSI